MIFNSLDFAIFLPIVFLLYWFVTKHNLRLQNFLLLIASYIFYGWWDWRFLLLIFFSSCVDYLIGQQLFITKDGSTKKLFLTVSLVVNLGLLGFFKYYNFFLDSLVNTFSLFGQPISPQGLNIILPVGISFYTFQTLSYSLDIYRGKLKPTQDFIAFLAFVSFFPQLVAGPIERATNLLPQFARPRKFDYHQAQDGMRQILWGLFKKTVISDNCAVHVNDIFAHHTDYSGSTLLLGVILFALQIYADFSGYSDIAIGTSRLFGFNLMKNFAFPYFSRNIAEFWRRWHISLLTWFRDYIYIPLGGSRGGKPLRIRNTLIVFLISGFWHGASWKFVVWGGINGIYFLPLLLTNKTKQYTNTVAQGKLLPSLKEIAQMSLTFSLTLVAWVFFRAESISSAVQYLQGIFSPSIFAPVEVIPTKAVLLFTPLFLIVEWLQREKEHGLQFNGIILNKVGRWGVYYLLIAIILYFSGSQQEFVYFQF